MTQKILGSHSMIHTQAEPWVLLHPLHSLRNENIAATYNQKVNVRGTKGFIESLPGGEDEYWAQLGGAYSRMYGSILQGKRKTIFLDKTPRYYLIANEIPKMFPDSSIICLVRNPFAVLNSIVTTWTRAKLFTLSRYRQDLLEAPFILRDILERPGGNIISLRYEHLVQEPDILLPRICERLGIPYEASMVDYNRDTVFSLGDQKTVDVLGAPDVTLQDSWISGLDDPQVWRLQREYFDVLGRQVITQLGYDADSIEGIINSLKPSFSSLRSTISLKVLLDDQRDSLLGLHRMEAVSNNRGEISKSLEYRIGLILTAPFKRFKHVFGMSTRKIRNKL